MFSKIFRIFKKKIDGKTAEEWFELALKEKDLRKKVEYYNKVLEIEPENAKAWNNKGIALSKLEKYEEAIECFDKSLSIKDDPKVRKIKEKAEMKLGDAG